jgi:uncharacterized cupredoxin-like copper-binding protein
MKREHMTVWSPAVRATDHMQRHRRLPLAALVFVLLACCTPGERVSSARMIDVDLKDFAIHASEAVVPAGSVELNVYNAGPATHEFVVVRTDLPADQLPIASDGLSVDEEELNTAGEISDVPIWGTDTIELHLAPGHYVFFCNLDGHYLGGMHLGVAVTTSA